MAKVYSLPTSNNSDSLTDFKEKLLREHKNNLIILVDRYVEKLEEYGFQINQKFKKDSLKKINKELYELRPIPARLFLYFDGNNFFIILHGFVKKVQKTPRGEIKKAMEEIKRWKTSK